MRNPKLLATLIVGAACLLPFVAGATSFVIPRDEVLVRQAPVITEVAVMSVSPSPAKGPPSTDYIVLVERLLKGRVAGTSIVVRVPGGLGADGVGLKVHGAPVFREGERLLLFLTARDDGAYGVLHLGLGAFHQLTGHLNGDERKVALRSLIGAADRDGADGLLDAPRDWEAFSSWLAETSSGRQSAPEYFLSVGDVEFQPLPVGVDPMPILWQRFSQGRRVRWRFQSESSLQRHWVRRSLDDWTQAGETSVRLRPAKVSGLANGLQRPDGFNDIVVEDPSKVIAGSFSCTLGGVAAVSATWFDPAVTFRFQGGAGGVAIRAQEAEIVFNDGAGCLFRRSGGGQPLGVLSHEIGHTLGLDHSGDPLSPMFPVVIGREALSLGEGLEVSPLEALYPARPGIQSRASVADSHDH